MDANKHLWSKFFVKIVHDYKYASLVRSSRPEVFLIILQNSQENTCAWVSFLIKLQASPCNFIKKRDSGTGVFLWIFWNFSDHFFLKNTSGGCICLVTVGLTVENNKLFSQLMLNKKPVVFSKLIFRILHSHLWKKHWAIKSACKWTV